MKKHGAGQKLLGKSWRSLVVLSLLCCLLVIPAQALAESSQRPGRVQGQVTDADGNPLAGVQVKATNPEAPVGTLISTSDDGGYFSVIGLITGRWSFSFQKEGYVTHELDGNVSTLDRNPNMDVTLEKTEGSTYADPGATAHDAFEGDISDNVQVSGAVVNLARIGVYEIHYDATDTSGNPAATVTRTVEVVNATDPPIMCECPPDVAQSLCEELDIGDFGTTNKKDLREVIRLHIEAAASDSCLQEEIDQCVDDFLAAIGL